MVKKSSLMDQAKRAEQDFDQRFLDVCEAQPTEGLPSQGRDEMEQSPVMRSDYLVSGIRTPPVRRNSKLATLGRIFKPWKWRKKKNEKLKQTSAVLEKKMAARQGRDELIKKGLLEMMEQAKKPSAPTEELEDASLPASEDSPQALLVSESTDSPQKQTERNPAQLPSPPLLPAPPPKALSKITKSVTAGSEIDDPAMKSPPSTILKNYVIVGSSQISGQAALFHPSAQKSSDPHVRGQVESFDNPRPIAKENLLTKSQVRVPKANPAPNIRTLHMSNATISVYVSWLIHEHIRLSGLMENMWYDIFTVSTTGHAITVGTLPRKCKKELLAVKLRNRPSKQELEDRNIFPRRTDEERQEIRQQIEMKLSKNHPGNLVTDAKNNPSKRSVGVCESLSSSHETGAIYRATI
ncbi:phosphatase and actin regulator hypothetical protein [Limosa lapponica baueri]|uniref:Phosphatase and actin regulator 3 n=1 Tax=Limosa lapponica baueri TaxID=1758121 RepID=A0A2I0TWX9_LIMLA|nr:phosphatase and actin regulator hypothetical protein [Limosa lapponica baueri]